jgi:hypothetical protein
MCLAAKVAPPEFPEITEAAVVTFRVPVAQAVAPGPRPESRPESVSLEERILAALSRGPLSKSFSRS